MLSLASSVGRFVRNRFLKGERESYESDIAEYLHQRDEIALQSLQESLRNLKKYQIETGPTQG